MYCVYCNENHDGKTAFSPEHIIPIALGGVDSFTIPVCRKSNNDIGNRIDSPFIRMFFVNSDRFFLDLKSHRGKPTLDLSGITVIDGNERPIQYEIRDGKKVLKIADPSVEIKKLQDKEQFNVSGDPSDVRKVLLGKLASAEKKGQTLQDENGERLTPDNVDDLITKKTTVHVNPDVLMNFQIHSYDPLRFFCKIGLAAGFRQLGESFGTSSIGDKLRRAMFSSNDEEIIFPGMFWPFDRDNQGTYKFFKVPETHVLAFVPMEGNPLIITLFGGRYTAAIPLQDLSASSSDDIQEGHVFQIDLKAKQLKQSSYGDYILQRPWLQTASI